MISETETVSDNFWIICFR